MVVHPASGRVIVGGSFNTLNGATQNWGMGSLDGVTGAVQPWAANTIIQNHNDSSAISALTTDGEKIYGTGWAFFGGGATANFEGVFAADPMTGVLDWIDGGRGDNYGIAITGKVLYTVGHPHDWGMLGWNPQYDPYKWQRTMAISTQRSATLTNAYGTPDIWQPFMGRPAAQPLHWLPTHHRRHLHRSGPGRVERRDQRRLRRRGRRVPEGQQRRTSRASCDSRSARSRRSPTTSRTTPRPPRR